MQCFFEQEVGERRIEYRKVKTLIAIKKSELLLLLHCIIKHSLIRHPHDPSFLGVSVVWRPTQKAPPPTQTLHTNPIPSLFSVHGPCPTISLTYIYPLTSSISFQHYSIIHTHPSHTISTRFKLYLR